MKVLISVRLIAAILGLATIAIAKDSILIGNQGQKQTDNLIKISFKPPTKFEESEELAKKNGFEKAYKLPAPDGNSRSCVTVSFQKKTEEPGLRNLTEYVNVDLNSFKKSFPNSLIAQVNVQGIIADKFAELDFPMEMFKFKGDRNSTRFDGSDSLTLFFETPSGFWSIVWTVPYQVIQTGFPVFEGFIQDMSVQKLYEAQLKAVKTP
jgi:hypothetical protein